VPVRWVEVKAMTGTLDNRPVTMSRPQFDCAREHGENYWLYVVERADSLEQEITENYTCLCSKMRQSCENWRHRATLRPGFLAKKNLPLRVRFILESARLRELLACSFGTAESETLNEIA